MKELVESELFLHSKFRVYENILPSKISLTDSLTLKLFYSRNNHSMFLITKFQIESEKKAV